MASANGRFKMEIIKTENLRQESKIRDMPVFGCVSLKPKHLLI
jgi:hypothetical protein